MSSYFLRSDELELTVLTLGSTAASLKYRGRETMLGYATEEEYAAGDRYYSAIIGRYGNRIGNAAFVLDGREYRLTANKGQNQLHGGPHSFDKRQWTVEHADSGEIRLSLFSPDGDNGFPGNLKTSITYSLDGPVLRLVFEAETDAPTVFAPTFHPYFLCEETPSLYVNAHRHLEVDSKLIPTGRLLPCNGPFDFSRLRVMDGHYDDAFVLAGTHALTLRTSAYTLEMHTDFPAAQVYNGHPGTLAVALEPEFFPDSPNHPCFPSTALYPGERFHRWVEYRFC